MDRLSGETTKLSRGLVSFVERAPWLTLPAGVPPLLLLWSTYLIVWTLLLAMVPVSASFDCVGWAFRAAFAKRT